MENEVSEGVIATYAQLLANAQRQAITAQVKGEILTQRLAAKDAELEAAITRIGELENPPAEAEDPVAE